MVFLKKPILFIIIFLVIFTSFMPYHSGHGSKINSFSQLNNIEYKVMSLTGVTNISKIVEITKTQSLNIRSGPSTAFQILGQVSEYSQFYAYEKATGTNVYGNDVWYHIYWNGTNGWISAYYTTQPAYSAADIGGAISIDVATLNVRTGPGTNYGIIGHVYQDQIYVLTSHESFLDSSGNSWLEIYFNNQTAGYTGYVYALYTYSLKLSNYSQANVKEMSNYGYQSVTLKKVFMPYLYPNYNGYASDFATYADYMSGIQYEQYYLTSSLTLGDGGDGGVGATADQYNIPKWPMIVNGYNVTRTHDFLNDTIAQTNFINTALSDAITYHYAGYSIDFEGTIGYTPQDAQNYITFLNNFADALHQHGIKLAVAPQPAYNGNPNSELDYYLYHPYTPIHVDYVMPQCYAGVFSGSVSFQSSVNSILNAVGQYFSKNQIVVLLITDNPNTNYAPFTAAQMNERINYIESKNVNGIGMWSLNQVGGFPASQHLWGQIIDFEFSQSEWSNYEAQYSNGAVDWVVSHQNNNYIDFQILGAASQIVPVNGSATVSYSSYSPLTEIKFNYQSYLPSGVNIMLYGLDNAGSVIWSHPLSSSGVYDLSLPSIYTIEIQIYTSSWNNIPLSFTNPSIAYIKDLKFGAYGWNYSYAYNTTGLTLTQNSNSVHFAVEENQGWTEIAGYAYTNYTSSTPISYVSFTLSNTQVVNVLESNMYALSDTGTLLNSYIFLNNQISQFGSKNFNISVPSGTYKIEFLTDVCEGNNSANATWEIDISNIFFGISPISFYSITFTESGLPTGTLWWVNLSELNKSSTTTTIVFNEPNGIYSYIVSTPIAGATGVRYITTGSGSVTVNGANVYKAIPYTTQYYLTMSVSPSGAGTVTPTSEWVNASQSITIKAVPNAGYLFSSWSGSGNGSYAGTSNPATITMNGPVSETANFVVNTYTVTFTESGLPTGTEWWINITGGGSYSSTSTSLSFKEPNGTYTYSAASANKQYRTPGGSFTVKGANVNQAITFTKNTYTITFTESGLLSGTIWYVNLSNGQTFSSTTTIISFTEPNSTYSYTVATANKEYAPSPSFGSFTVAGASVSKSITFSLVTYTVTFTETGLTTGTNWSITFNGATYFSTTPTITINVPNGTYDFTVNNIQGESVSLGTGSLVIYGTAKSEQITFNGTQTAPLTNKSPILNSGTFPYLLLLLVAILAAILLAYRRRFTVRISTDKTTIGIDKTTQITSIVSGGSKPYKYEWFIDGSPAEKDDHESLLFSATNTGITTVHLKVTDNKGKTATSEALQINVVPF